MTQFNIRVFIIYNQLVNLLEILLRIRIRTQKNKYPGNNSKINFKALRKEKILHFK